MRISQLVEESGVPLATVKYYLREGLLPAGTATTATQADYGEQHLHRLRVIRALTGAAGLPVQQARAVLALIDAPDGSLFDSLGRAVAALPPYAEAAPDDAYPRARAVIERLGQFYDPSYAAVAQLEHALRAAEDAGLPISDDRIEVYGRHLHAIAEFDVGQMPRATADGSDGSNAGSAAGSEAGSAAIEYAVLGTALYEPVILAMRRLAHQDVAAGLLNDDRG
ncbi:MULTISPECIES: MerR family transcriptional regulator [unclassified Leifsonia]|uniref:MerR family transcriptional regulator n=1 Tax=unclassified Leifsonia TaxID=2663824 RepID=UPI0006FEE568|nr:MULTISPECIES: MerR family transcriptional regulator [unclassified Leifsonia]KQX05648.1 MerR family transcriptional regulator [Leifsonia sp. Root1293]KRA09283.1 MerR family transcriptional regulator [Leifsonia sp. Root60]